jgi:hypothetical protein
MSVVETCFFEDSHCRSVDRERAQRHPNWFSSFLLKWQESQLTGPTSGLVPVCNSSRSRHLVRCELIRRDTDCERFPVSILTECSMTPSLRTGQPFEVIKTQVAANRTQSLFTACKNIFSRGGAKAFWQGLYPWAWIEAATKGGVLLLAQNEIQTFTVNRVGVSKELGSMLGGIGGGVAQAYTTVGFCSFMKTVRLYTAPCDFRREIMLPLESNLS